MIRRPLAITAAAYALLVAGLVLVGRLAGVASLTTLWPDGPALKPQAALALALGATSLALAMFAPRLRGAQAGFGLSVAALGAAILLERASAVGPGNGAPPVPAGVGFVALGLALALLPARRPGLLVVRDAFAGAASVVGCAGVLAFFAAPADPGLDQTLFRAPAPGSLAVVLLALGVLAAHRGDRRAGELVGVVAPILGLAALAVLAGVTLASSDAQRRLRDRAHDAEAAALALDDLLGGLRDAENGQRGFLLTGDETYLQPWVSAAPKVARSFDRIAALVGGSDAVRSEMNQIRGLMQAKLAELQQTIDLKRAGETDAALAIVRSNVGKSLMERLRREITTMRDACARNGDGLRASADRASARLLYAILVSVSVVAVLGLFLFLDGRRRVVTMRRAQRALAAANAGLDRLVVEQTRELAVALGRARSELAMRNEAEAAARQSEKRLRLLTDATSSAVYAMTPDWKTMRRLTSDGFLAAVEAAEDDWLERFIPACERERVLAAIRTAVATKSVFRLEHQVVREDGRLGWVVSTAAPVFDEGGAIVEWVGAATDVTEQKRAESALVHSEKRLRVLIEASSSIVFRMSPDWTEMRQLTGGGFPSEIVERRGWVRRLVPRADRAAVIAGIRAAIADRSPFELDHRIVQPDGSVGWVHSRAAPVLGDDGEIVEWFGFATDIGERKRAEERLRDSEALLSAMLSQMPIAVGVTDRGGRFLIKNARMNRFAHEYAASCDGEIFSHWLASDAAGEPIPQDAFPVARVLSGHPEVSMEALILDRDGRKVWVEAAAAPLLSQDGALLGAIPTVVDIDRRKRAEQALRASERRVKAAAEALRLGEARLRHAANSARLTFVDIDLGTGEATAAENFALVMGYAAPAGGAPTPEAIAGLLCRPDGGGRAAVVDAVGALLAGGPVATIEHAVAGDGGVTRWIETVLDVAPHPDGRPARLFAAHRDVTASVEGRAALARAKAEAERANLAKSKFLAAASHDLRQPVQSLVLLMSLVEKQVRADARATQTVAMMKTALGGLNGLLTAILDISRLDAGAIEPAPEIVDLGGMVVRLATEYAQKAGSKGLALRVAAREVAVATDPALLERALRNLIDNALRYTARGGVLIGLRRRGGCIRVDVVDTGRGVPACKQTEIFEEFRQLHNPGRDLGKGLGLGLAIVARLAPLIGATVEVSSRPGRGSRFSLVMPLSPEPARGDAETAAPAVAAHGAVLVIEDNEILRHSLAAMVGDWGYAVTVAANGEEALNLNSAGARFDAIVTDFRLGEGLNGIEAALEIERDVGRPLPKLVLTGDTARESLAEIRASGFGCLHKPVAAEALRRKLAEMLAA